MDSEYGYSFSRNTREGIDPKRKFDDNDLISLLKVDSTKSKAVSYYLIVLLKDNKGRGETKITLEFTDGNRLILKKQMMELTDFDYGFGFDENEIFYPLDLYSYEEISKADLVKIEIHDRNKISTVIPDKNLLKRQTKCLR